MKTSFKNISQYLGFYPDCPFCKKELVVEIITSLHDNSCAVHSTKHKANGIHYMLSSRVFGADDCFTDFKITLRLNGQLSYIVKNSKSYEKKIEKKRFIDAFNNSHTQILQSCNNNFCTLDYIKQSLPLFLDEEGLNSPQLYHESFRYKRYTFANNYVDNIAEIYVYDQGTPPLQIPFYELTEKSAPAVFNRINMAVVFC